nr:MAG TPA: Mediator of RNA polymerase II, Transcription Activation, Helical, ABD [Caudoviricetes sp.]
MSYFFFFHKAYNSNAFIKKYLNKMAKLLFLMIK